MLPAPETVSSVHIDVEPTGVPRFLKRRLPTSTWRARPIGVLNADTPKMLSHLFVGIPRTLATNMIGGATQQMLADVVASIPDGDRPVAPTDWSRRPLCGS